MGGAERRADMEIKVESMVIADEGQEITREVTCL
jgi:hypothetical protein